MEHELLMWHWELPDEIEGQRRRDEEWLSEIRRVNSGVELMKFHLASVGVNPSIADCIDTEAIANNNLGKLGIPPELVRCHENQNYASAKMARDKFFGRVH